MHRKSAFTLAETLLAVTVLLLLCGGMMLIPAGKDRSAEIRKAEADRLVAWLSDKMIQAQADERTFQLELTPRQTYNMRLRVLWQDGTGDQTIFESDKVQIWYKSGSSEKIFRYDPTWHTFSPAITLYVKMGGNRDGTGIPVTVSGQGYVRAGDLIKEKS